MKIYSMKLYMNVLHKERTICGLQNVLIENNTIHLIDYL
jgi:hypothetical protein